MPVKTPPPPPPTTEHASDSCAHCHGPLEPHTTEDKDAETYHALHCTGCGCCFKAKNGELRARGAFCTHTDED